MSCVTLFNLFWFCNFVYSENDNCHKSAVLIYFTLFSVVIVSVNNDCPVIVLVCDEVVFAEE